MKKIFNLLILFAGLTMFTACGDDDPTYTAPVKLEVKSADAFYESTGGSGTIVVNTSEALTATSDADWLTVSVDGSTVSMTVAENIELEGRSGNVVLKTATATASVNITQKGIVYGITLSDELLQIADTANSVTAIPVAHSAAVTVKSLTDWLSASFDEESSSIVVTGQANPDKASRTGYVAFATGTVKDTLAITQKGHFDFAKEVLGEYLFVYYYYDEEAADFANAYFDATLTADGLTIQYPATQTMMLPFTVPVAIDADNQVVKFGPNGSFLGMYGSSHYIFLQFGAYVQGIPVAPYTDNTTCVSSVINFQKLDPNDETQEEVLVMDFAGKFDEYDIDLWLLEAYDSKNFAESSYVTDLEPYLIAPYMIQIPGDEAAAPAARRAAAVQRAARLMSQRPAKMPVLHGPLKAGLR